MESKSSLAKTKRSWHVLRLIYYMLRNSFSRRKLMMELQLFLKRGKLAGKALGSIITFHRHGGNASRRPVDDGFHAGMIAEALKMLKAEEMDIESAIASSMMPTPSPSPGAMWWFGRSPVFVRQLRVTDSPFMMCEEEVVEDGKVDKDADKFIRWFREQLWLEKLESDKTKEDPSYYCGEEI